MIDVEKRASQIPSERVEVFFRQEWVDIRPPMAPAAVIHLDGGVCIRETYTQTPSVHGVFTVLASKAASRARDVKAVHDELLALMEDLRLVWYFSGGYWIRTPAESNFESIHARLFEAEHGHAPFTESLLHKWNVIVPYRQMPLLDAIGLLRELGRLNPISPDEHKSALWTCLQAFHAATVAVGPTERFMRAFPALDLLASTHYGEPALNPSARSVLRHIRNLSRN
jgi:hypothetical protein